MTLIQLLSKLIFKITEDEDRRISIQYLNHSWWRCELIIKKTKIHWDLNQDSQSGQILNQGRYDWVGVIRVISIMIRVMGTVIQVIEIPGLGDWDSIFVPITSVNSISITHLLYPASDLNPRSQSCTKLDWDPPIFVLCQYFTVNRISLVDWDIIWKNYIL